ncbi:MAG TPA: hypothetical protein VK700_15850 [Steroidobacteraceae bacterium]|jgi:hypothetical protein|nr:hypothetical protein [Steroidobacteraceae bacterium]
MRLLAGLLVLVLAPAHALADYASPDAIDRQTLERALFLCQWKSSHEVPENAPIPAVCKSATVSIEDAMLQDKQWWTFWARFNSEEALKANQQFSADFVAFQARLKIKPELAQGLLPAGIRLAKDDWRVWLVHQLAQP